MTITVGVHRPQEASLPPREKPQSINIGGRSRISHIARKHRLYPGTVPKGFPGDTGIPNDEQSLPVKGLSYRNAAFQALLNVPMFVNFVRYHGRDGCSNIRDCLTCGMKHLINWYWAPETRQSKIDEALLSLWERCLNAFWGKRARAKRNIGPTDIREEFYTEAFLLHFLSEMQRQLKANPNEFQTFQRMFTTHIGRSFKCNMPYCQHVNSTSRWESTLYLAIDVVKPHRKSTQTNIFHGVERGLQRWTTFAPGLTVTVPSGRCEKCFENALPISEIVNAPEILVLVRNLGELGVSDRPDIPYTEYLELQPLMKGKDKSKDSNKVTYQLVSVTAERTELNETTGQSLAFVRGPSNGFYAVTNKLVQAVAEPAYMDKIQRVQDDLSDVRPIYPEVFIYVRVDDNGRQEMYAEDDTELMPVTPGIPTIHARNRHAVGYQLNVHLNERIGQGLLKLSAELFPSKPHPQQVIDVNIRATYELDNNSWTTFLPGKLYPNTEGNTQVLPQTPWSAKPFMRARKRDEGLSPTQLEHKRIQNLLITGPGAAAIVNIDDQQQQQQQQHPDPDAMETDPVPPRLPEHGAFDFARHQRRAPTNINEGVAFGDGRFNGLDVRYSKTHAEHLNNRGRGRRNKNRNNRIGVPQNNPVRKRSYDHGGNGGRGGRGGGRGGHHNNNNNNNNGGGGGGRAGINNWANNKKQRH